MNGVMGRNTSPEKRTTSREDHLVLAVTLGEILVVITTLSLSNGFGEGKVTRGAGGGGFTGLTALKSDCLSIRGGGEGKGSP